MTASLGETPIFAQITEKMRGSGFRHPTSNDHACSAWTGRISSNRCAYGSARFDTIPTLMPASRSLPRTIIASEKRHMLSSSRFKSASRDSRSIAAGANSPAAAESPKGRVITASSIFRRSEHRRASSVNGRFLYRSSHNVPNASNTTASIELFTIDYAHKAKNGRNICAADNRCSKRHPANWDARLPLRLAAAITKMKRQQAFHVRGTSLVR